jgi:hypothetical protein
MAEFVYILCALTSLICMIMLVRSYIKNRVRLLFWSALCFGGQVMSNCALLLDLIIYPQTNFMLFRLLPAFVGFALLIYGLIWDVA